MFRYMAAIWDPRNETARQAAERMESTLHEIRDDWNPAFQACGIRVYSTGFDGGRAYVLPERRGVILGRLFRRSSNARIYTIDEAEGVAIAESKGGRLISDYWGRYVALLFDPRNGSRVVVKDPTGRLPCFHVDRHGVTLYFSCLQDVVALRSFRFQINWRHVIERIGRARGSWGETGLAGIAEIIGGAAVEHADGSRSERMLWDPESLAQSEIIEDPRLAADVLRSTVRFAVRTCASEHRSILVRTSGGLDSTIVLGCLRTMTEQPLVTCVHYYTATRRPEESPWAKLVAEHFGLDILCHACEVHVPIEALLRMAPMVSPPPDYSWALAGDYEREAAAFTKATAIMTGDGGDPAFGRYSEDFACIDFLKQRGLGRGILALAADVALLRNRSAWSVLAEALTHDPTAIRLEDARRIRNGRTLVSDDVFEAALTAVRSHPWFKSIGRSSVSDTLETVTQADLFYDPLRPATEIDLEPLHPLCSQPVIETCLRIPSYVRMQGGRSRGLARKAFQSDLPPQIYSRRWKDAGQGSAYELMRKSGAAIREFLLEGVLIQNHLLDRRRVEESLSATPGKHAAVVHELADHVIVEAWLRTAERVGFGPGASVCV